MKESNSIKIQVKNSRKYQLKSTQQVAIPQRTKNLKNLKLIEKIMAVEIQSIIRRKKDSSWFSSSFSRHKD